MIIRRLGKYINNFPQAARNVIRCACSYPSLLLLTCLLSIATSGQTMRHDHNHDAAKVKTKPEVVGLVKGPGVVTDGEVKIVIPDLLVRDQNGKQKHFYSDLIKNKVVVLSFFFTSCESVCPAMGMALSRLQTNLGDRLGTDVFIVTVTKDPQTDSPAKLKAWGEKMGVKRGWTMVTGETKVMEKIVRDFTGDSLGQGMHNTIFLMGNDKTGEWTESGEFTSGPQLLEKLDLLSKP